MNIFDLLVVQPIFNLLISLYSVIPGGDFGVSLIIFTILVRIALFPLVKKQLHQTKTMRKLQPELTKIKAETKGNKQLETTMMMDLYKRHGVSPFRSILILLVQLPIFIALYQVIRIFTYDRGRIEEFTYSFLEDIEPIREIINNPDNFNEKLFGVIDLTENALSNAWILAIALVAAITQYYMSKQLMPQTDSKRGLRQIMSEAAEGKQADQAEMNALIASKMTKVFPFIMLFIMIGLPGALVLYYAVSNLVAVIQQASVLRHDEEDLEELAEEGIEKAPKKQKKAPKTAPKKSKNTPNITRISAKGTNKKGRK